MVYYLIHEVDEDCVLLAYYSASSERGSQIFTHRKFLLVMYQFIGDNLKSSFLHFQ